MMVPLRVWFYVQAGLSDLLGLAGTGNIQVSSIPLCHIRDDRSSLNIFIVASVAVPRTLKPSARSASCLHAG